MTSWTLHPRRLTAGTWEYGPPSKRKIIWHQTIMTSASSCQSSGGVVGSIYFPNPGCGVRTSPPGWHDLHILGYKNGFQEDLLLTQMTHQTTNFLRSWNGNKENRKKKLNHCRTLKTLGLNVSLKGFDTFNLGQTKIPSSQFQLSSCFVFWAAIAGTQMEK